MRRIRKSLVNHRYVWSAVSHSQRDRIDTQQIHSCPGVGSPISRHRRFGNLYLNLVRFLHINTVYPAKARTRLHSILDSHQTRDGPAHGAVVDTGPVVKPSQTKDQGH